MRVKPRGLARFDSVAKTTLTCSECTKPIHPGKKVILLVRWVEEYRFPSDGHTFVSGWSDEMAETEVKVIFDPNPRVIAETETGASRDGTDCVLASPPTFTLHHPGCGVDDRPIRRVPGSYGMGKRR